jgi:RNA polymerase sigma-32 factor
MSGALTLANNNWATTALMPSLGNLDAYITAANRMPMLTAEEEQHYAKQWRDAQDVDAAGRLVLSHLRLVISTARQYLGYGLPHADLIQEGNVGLMKAVKRFDPEQGVRLVSYALHWIKAEIHEYILKNFRMIKVATTKAQRKLFFNLRSMKQGFKHDAAEAEDGMTHRDSLNAKEIDTVARRLNVKPEEVIEMEARFAGGDVLLDPTPTEGDDGDQAFGPIAYLSDSSMEPTAQLEARERDHLAGDGVQSALEQLDPRSRRIIEERWLKVNDNGSGGLTLHDLAAEYGVSAERIRQIEVAAMKKMKKALEAA